MAVERCLDTHRLTLGTIEVGGVPAVGASGAARCRGHQRRQRRGAHAVSPTPVPPSWTLVLAIQAEPLQHSGHYTTATPPTRLLHALSHTTRHVTHVRTCIRILERSNQNNGRNNKISNKIKLYLNLKIQYTA